MGDRSAGVAAGLAAYVLWGLLTVYWKELSGLDAFGLIGQRILWALLVLVPVLALRGGLGALGRLRAEPRLVGRTAVAALLLATNWTTYVWAVTHDNVVETALGYFIAPLGTVALGVVVLRERLRPPQIVALALAATAVGVLTLGYGRLPVFALILGVTWSLYGLLKKVVPLSAVQSLTAETLVLAPVAIVLVVLTAPGGDGLVATATPLQLVLVPLSGLVTTVPLLLFAYAAQRVPLTTLGPLQYAVPTINFLLGVLVYDEALPPWRLAGFVLVWVALVVLTVDAVRSARWLRRVPADQEPAVAT